MALWRPADDAGELEPSGPVTHGGRTYKKVESGKARFTSTGTTGVPDSGAAWYVDYEGRGRQAAGLRALVAGGLVEVSTGEVVPRPPARDLPGRPVERSGRVSDPDPATGAPTPGRRPRGGRPDRDGEAAREAAGAAIAARAQALAEAARLRERSPPAASPS